MLLLAAAPAWAGEEDAKSFFAEGRTLRTQHKCDEAIVRFRRALEVYPEGLGSLRNVAECEEELGRFAAARRDWWDLRRAVMQSNEAKYDGWDKEAEGRYKALEQKVGRITVNLAGVELERVKVVIDGKPFDNRLLGTELERDLGSHTIEGFYGGASPVTKHVEVGQGQSVAVVLDIPAPSADKPKKVAPPRSNTMRNVGIVALTGGFIAVSFLTVAATVRGQNLADIEKACPKYETDPCIDPKGELKSKASEGKNAAVAVNVLAIVSAVGILGGASLIYAGTRPPKKEAAGALRLDVGALPGGAAASARVRF